MPAYARSGSSSSSSSILKTTETNMYYSSPYKLTNVSVNSFLPWFDYGHTKGPKDMITGKFFGKMMQDLPRKGWMDDDADSGWETHLITFEITKTTATKNEKKTDSFKLLYNTGRDTDGQNEDYSFVAMRPADTNHVKKVGSKKMITVFGVPFDLSSLNYNVSTGNTLIANYIYTGHDYDHGNDDERGNILEGIKYTSPCYSGLIEPNIQMTEGERSLEKIALNLVLTVVNTLDHFSLNR